MRQSRPRTTHGADFAARVVGWQRAHGRHDLPWSGSDPYRVWLAEVMLQQTQVATVIGYYQRFLTRFPDVRALAAAPLEDVLKLWSGLGYYARARNLHACARAIVDEHGGAFPRAAKELERLPGIGRSTAAAIAAFCYRERAAILDGNVKRVLARHFGIEGDPSTAAVQRRLWQQAEALLPAAADMPAYTQGLMDLGATVCVRTAPRCAACPLADTCVAKREQRIETLPAPRVRGTRPLRRAHWLLAVHDGRVLLRQQGPVGLWGGLLAPPQFASARAVNEALPGIAPSCKVRRLPARRLEFTHFTLLAVPHLARIGQLRPRTAEPHDRWLPLADIETAALPAPVRTLLRELGAAHSGSTPSATRKRDTML
ncbi:MAG TPA: A/G-specific adenine glycosylase [Burkholderiaceae bacterium]|nr:A/G-specific adenine glycosylase [Burkholderiaceae bacterium]